MKKILIIGLITLSFSVFATSIKRSTTVEMTQEEVQLAIQLANTYEVALDINGPCTATKFEISSVTRGFNPATWTLNAGENSYELQDHEISELVSLFNRINPTLIVLNSVQTEQRVYIRGASCGFTPNDWTVTFN